MCSKPQRLHPALQALVKRQLTTSLYLRTYVHTMHGLINQQSRATSATTKTLVISSCRGVPSVRAGWLGYNLQNHRERGGGGSLVGGHHDILPLFIARLDYFWRQARWLVSNEIDQAPGSCCSEIMNSSSSVKLDVIQLPAPSALNLHPHSSPNPISHLPQRGTSALRGFHEASIRSVDPVLCLLHRLRSESRQSFCSRLAVFGAGLRAWSLECVRK